MRKDRVSLLYGGMLALAFVSLAGSCGLSSGPDPFGRLIGRTNCKGSGGSVGGTPAAPASSQECVEYDYDGRSLLRLKHINAGFNCCPGTVSADIEISGDTIRIKEKESSSLCDCSCLYDLRYEIIGLDRGTYRISVVGPYQPEGDPPLIVLLDLEHANSGSACVDRTRYPWGY